MLTAQMGKRGTIDPLGAQNVDIILLDELVRGEASAGPNTMWPALWTMTSNQPSSAMTWAMPASADASDCTSSSTVRRSAFCSAAQAATAATWGALRPVVSRIEA